MYAVRLSVLSPLLSLLGALPAQANSTSQDPPRSSNGIVMALFKTVETWSLLPGCDLDFFHLRSTKNSEFRPAIIRRGPAPAGPFVAAEASGFPTMVPQALVASAAKGRAASRVRGVGVDGGMDSVTGPAQPSPRKAFPAPCPRVRSCESQRERERERESNPADLSEPEARAAGAMRMRLLT